MFNCNFDYVDAVVDEIALEGLDGITLEALWVRLSQRPNFVLALDDASKSFIWDFVRRVEGMNMYKLPTPRKPLVIFNRYEFMDKELGMVLEPDEIPEDPYPHCAVEDTKNNVRGSCSTYYTRVDVTSEAVGLSLREVDQKWGLGLVVVASQALRNAKLMGQTTNPRLDILLLQYCLLERVGRSRYMGEVTQGKTSLQKMSEDPKTLFYYRKFLLHHRLIVKQVHHEKIAGHNCSGSLLHLPRFHVERKPKILFLTEKVVTFLKSQPQQLAEYSQVRELLGFTNSFRNPLKRLLKTFDFQRYVKADMVVPYRQLYPDASVSEWKHKGSDKEKNVRVLKLLDPGMDIQEIWSKYEENMYEEDEDDENAGLLDLKNLYMDQALLSQVFSVVDRAGPKGLSQIELGQAMGLTKLQARGTLRNLLKRGLVSIYMNDVGRQRVSRYVSLRYEKESILSVQFAREKDRMLTLLSDRPSTGGRKRAAEDDGKSAPALPRAKRKKQQQPKKPTVNSVLARLGLVQPRVASPTSDEEGSEVAAVSRGGRDEPGERSAICGDAVASTSTATVEGSVPEEKADRIADDQSVAGSSKSWQNETTSGFVEDLKNLDQIQESLSITYRILKRANLIVETVRSHKVIYDLHKLMKLIYDEEVKEGYNVRIDKKSLLRLLLKLARDGNIKIFKVYLKTDTKEKVLSFVCDPTICADHTVIQSAVEQAKMKFFIPPIRKPVKIPTDELPKVEDLSKENKFSFESASISESMKELKSICGKSKEKSPQYQYSKRMGRLYGLCPKFVRMKKFHQFLFYLIYAYEGDPNLDRQTALRKLAEKDCELDDSVAQEAATIYYPEAHWKMFVAPLPVHEDWPQGWAIMCDLLLRLPLSLFVEIFNITYVVPNMEEYLEHPVRRHYLLKFLPLEMRNVMMVARKYIFSIHEIAQHLCYAGLLQFGPQRLKDKDQVFVYLNRRTTLIDTTFSRQGYHQVSDDVDYPVTKYEFTSMSDVDNYWYDLWNICVHTQLGGRMCMMGKDIVLEVLQHKQIMVDALKARTPEEAAANDTGTVPGDRRGAAGLDSALFAHLKRNWSWTNQNFTGPYVYNAPSSIAFNKKLTELKSARLATLKTDILKSEIFQSLIKKDPIDPSATSFTSIIKKRPPMGKKGEKKSKPGREVPQKKMKARKMEIVRTVTQPMPKRPRRPFYDDVDQRALGRMNKLRVEWLPEEDNLLLLCKVASVYLCSNQKQHTITFPMVRDILHKKNPKYKNKTSRSCQRRILYVMKNVSTAYNVALHLEEMSQDPEISSQFKNALGKLRAEELKEEEFEAKVFEKFEALVELLEQKSCRDGYMRSGSSELVIIPDTVEAFRNECEVTYPRTSLKKRISFLEVKNIVDICCAVMNAVIHSSLCCMLDQCSDTFQLFQVYQQYPDNLLRSVIARLHSNQMVSLKKRISRRLHRTNHYIPISSLPYQLSISYVNLLQTKYQFEVFHESYEMLEKMHECMGQRGDDKGMEVGNLDGGRTAAFVELFVTGKVTFELEVPDQIIVLDPRISDKDETFARIVQRYHDVVTSTGRSASLKKLYGGASASAAGAPGTPGDSDSDPDVPDAFDRPVEDVSIVHRNVIARAASRIALYLLREEDSQGRLADELQHAHDFFVLNSCKVFCRPAPGAGLHPISRQKSDTVVDDIKRTMVFNDNIPTNDELHEKCINIGGNSEDWEKIKNILEYVGKKKELGVTLTELKEEFPNNENTMPLLRVLQLLSENRFLLRTGVCNVRYVYHPFLKPWLVRSFRTKLTHDTTISAGSAPPSASEVTVPESSGDWPAPPEDGSGNDTVMKDIRQVGEMSTEGVLPSEGSERCESPVLPKDMIVDPTILPDESAEPAVARPKATKGKTKITREQGSENGPQQENAEDVAVGCSSMGEGKKATEVGQASEPCASGSGDTEKQYRGSWKKCMTAMFQECMDNKVVDQSDRERIKVQVRPWVRIDGTLNRRVLDRMLGAVLGHAMRSPADTVAGFLQRFSPALQPFHVRELIEVLVKLGCIKLKVLKLSWKATLFSKPSVVTLVDADGTENDSDVIVEPEPDAILRLGTFIGKKEYLSDFLCC
ncbi:general transcription factor 3C polypeptide 1 isoform X2 [Bacillus rossius redtenbacheri]|uniref:general transcription factor 3C polypeptide 1 isoform X2 n=1 Tax=Bacillus rossius redtenbacheri TaxID=93214 RepID=UPI002FDE08FF